MTGTTHTPIRRRGGHAILRAALTGLGLGAVWGVLARVWMRLINDFPEFSWSGTLVIIAVFGLFGLAVGTAAAARRRDGSRWWLLGAVPGMLVFASQGMVMLPGFLVGSFALSRRTRSWRVVAVAAACVVPVILWSALRLDEDTMLPASTRAQWSMLVGLPVLTLGMAWFARDLWPRPRPRRSPAGGAAQSASPDLALSSLRSDSSLEAPAGPA
jgi:hypothetical protein